jgi:entry exclusion lipoprotein TrbK
MRLRLPVVAAILLAGCAIQQPPVNQQPSGLSDTPKSQINKDRDRDLSECERESAFAGAGDKRQVFDKCMKARAISRSPRHNRDNCPARGISSSETGRMHSGPSYFAELTIVETS